MFLAVRPCEYCHSSIRHPFTQRVTYFVSFVVTFATNSHSHETRELPTTTSLSDDGLARKSQTIELCVFHQGVPSTVDLYRSVNDEKEENSPHGKDPVKPWEVALTISEFARSKLK